MISFLEKSAEYVLFMMALCICFVYMFNVEQMSTHHWIRLYGRQLKWQYYTRTKVYVEIKKGDVCGGMILCKVNWISGGREGDM